MITRIRTRSDLLWYVQEHAPSGACRRAVIEGEVIVLGGFTQVPPFELPGWIVKISSVHGKHWLLAVIISLRTHQPTVKSIEKIPWEHWTTIGLIAEWCDIPSQAEHARRQAQEERGGMWFRGRKLQFEESLDGNSIRENCDEV